MTTFALDGKTITSVDHFHSAVAEQGNFPSYYGGNLDAFWDCMTTDVEGPILFTWENHEISANALGENFKNILELLIRISKARRDLTLDLR